MAEGDTAGSKRPATAPQKARVFFAVVYIAALIVLAVSMDGWPSYDAEGAWLWSGILLLVLCSALTEPYFPTPGDAVANGAAVTLAAVAFPGGAEAEKTFDVTKHALALGRGGVAVFGAVVVILGLCVIALRGPPGSARNEDSNLVFANRLLRAIGAARFAYSTVYLAATFAAFHDDTVVLAALWGFWVVAVIVRPLEWLYRYYPRDDAPAAKGSVVVTGLRNPGLVELAATKGLSLARGDVIAIDGKAIEVLDCAQGASGGWALAATTTGELPAIGRIGTIERTAARPALGYVDDGTSLQRLRFSVSARERALTSGELVSVDIEGAPVLYQVLDAEVRSSTIDRDVTNSRVLVDAARLGTWDDARKLFVRSTWLPVAGTAVRHLPATAAPLRREAIGHVPGTEFCIEADVETLVTHSAAVIGVLGSGKSTFARELVMRAIAEDIRVLVLDANPEHAEELECFLAEHPDDIAERVNTKIAGQGTQISQNKESGGSRPAFRDAIHAELTNFLDGEGRLCVLDLTKFDVTQQTSGVFSNQAGLGACTLPDLTAIVAEQAFEILKAKGRGPARLWVVLEEGHQLVPEHNAVSNKDDERAVQRTSKVFLQGRKFGFGSLVVTQRTANVSKHLVTQCNTMFCFRSHDDTTANFLKDRAGAAHITALPNLQDRLMLAFGKGIRCEDPLFIHVNDPADITPLLFPDTPDANGDHDAGSGDLDDGTTTVEVFDAWALSGDGEVEEDPGWEPDPEDWPEPESEPQPPDEEPF